MTKPSLYVVRTNYDWPEAFLQRPEAEVLEELRAHPEHMALREICGQNYDPWGKEFEQQLQQYRPGNIVPAIELFPGQVRATLDRSTQICFFSELKYPTLRSIIYLQGANFENEWIRGKLPIGFTSFDLIIDYVVNGGRFESLLRQLDDDFSVTRLELKNA